MYIALPLWPCLMEICFAIIQLMNNNSLQILYTLICGDIDENKKKWLRMCCITYDTILDNGSVSVVLSRHIILHTTYAIRWGLFFIPDKMGDHKNSIRQVDKCVVTPPRYSVAVSIEVLVLSPCSLYRSHVSAGPFPSNPDCIFLNLTGLFDQ